MGVFNSHRAPCCPAVASQDRLVGLNRSELLHLAHLTGAGAEVQEKKSRISEGLAPNLQDGSPLLSLSCQIFLLLSLYNNKPIRIPSLGLTFRQIPVYQESSLSMGQGKTICVVTHHRKNSKVLRGLGWHLEQMSASSYLKYLLGALCVSSV